MPVQLIKKGATTPIPYLLVDAATGQTGQINKAGSTTIYVSKNGATGVLAAGTITEVDSTNMQGDYTYTPTTGETNTTGTVVLHITCTGCSTVDQSVQIVGFDPASATFPIDLTTALDVSTLPIATNTVGNALWASIATGGGKQVTNGTSYVVYEMSGSTVVRTFTLSVPVATNVTRS